MIRDELHLTIANSCQKVSDWFQERNLETKGPIYASVDLREAPFKAAPVDANIFPAGFNNVCEIDRENAPAVFQKYISDTYSQEIDKVFLLAEENTKNLFYWDNVASLQELIRGAGFNCEVGVPAIEFPSQMVSASGKSIKVMTFSEGMEVYRPDLLISNNDFSTEYEFLSSASLPPLNPPYALGWHKRRKSRHFEIYNDLATEFSEMLSIDPWLVNVTTKKYEDFNISDDRSRDELAGVVEDVLEGMRSEYEKRKINATPTVFIKNNSGTYGMGVAQASSGDDVRTWNNKIRKKMKQGKGSKDIVEVIVQEGIPSLVRDNDGGVAEPVIYLIGGTPVGGFLRSHSQKGENESLNSPGAVFKRLCMSDLKVDIAGCPMENVYGTLARLSYLSTCREMGEIS